MIKHDTIKTILYGVAVGDAIGFPYQFVGRDVRKRLPVIEMGISRDAQGKLYALDEAEIGLWSDDSSLTLCLAESLASGYDLKDQAERFIAWFRKGYLSAMSYAFDVGNQTRMAIHILEKILQSGDYQRLAAMIEQPDVRANGNGALMRILPLVIQIYHLEIKEQLRLVTEASALTHPHLRSVICCLLYLRIAEKLIDQVELRDAVRASQKELRELLKDNEQPELDRLLNADLAQGSIDPDERDKADYIRSSGYVVDSLEAALWCLLTSSDYKETILKAVNLGDDTDTVAAIAGGLAALYYGVDSIPQHWTAALKKPELFQKIVSLY